MAQEGYQYLPNVLIWTLKPTSNDLLPMDRIVVAELNPEETIAYVRLTSIKEESVLALTHMSAPIMDEVVNVHKNDEITLFR
ncbi:hypothetical protein A6769_37640 [Nostoc punctiforme NIES-2108]|uniref:Uncharacterized protein n=2 Tax=Nostoc TaxID=1177 RepID=A0A367S0Q8_NOSPU|nr:hypothetical protein A6769_37640 [Nostoc punctiforme NIES-2108]